MFVIRNRSLSSGELEEDRMRVGEEKGREEEVEEEEERRDVLRSQAFEVRTEGRDDGWSGMAGG